MVPGRHLARGQELFRGVADDAVVLGVEADKRPVAAGQVQQIEDRLVVLAHPVVGGEDLDGAVILGDHGGQVLLEVAAAGVSHDHVEGMVDQGALFGPGRRSPPPPWQCAGPGAGRQRRRRWWCPRRRPSGSPSRRWSAFIRPAPEICSMWQWVSTPPGRTSRPAASITRSAGALREGAIFAMRPSARPRSASCRPSGVTRVPPRMMVSKEVGAMTIPKLCFDYSDTKCIPFHAKRKGMRRKEQPHRRLREDREDG